MVGIGPTGVIGMVAAAAAIMVAAADAIATEIGIVVTHKDTAIKGITNELFGTTHQH
jgi:hypothetical protein